MWCRAADRYMMRGWNRILLEDEMKRTICEAFDKWKGALIDLDKQTTRSARHRAHARVTSMEDLIAETPADDIEGVGIKLALYVYISGVDPRDGRQCRRSSFVSLQGLRSRSWSRPIGRSQEFDASKSAGHVKEPLVADTAASLGVLCYEEKNNATLCTVVPT